MVFVEPMLRNCICQTRGIRSVSVWQTYPSRLYTARFASIQKQVIAIPKVTCAVWRLNETENCASISLHNSKY